MRTVEARFWEKVNKTDGCWLWTGATTPEGYGQLGIGGKAVYAHRIAWEKRHGLVPGGLQIDHLCRVRNCVNPEHMEPVTRRENILRGNSPHAINARKTECKSGHPFNEQNTYHDRRYNRRRCRACWNS